MITIFDNCIPKYFVHLASAPIRSAWIQPQGAVTTSCYYFERRNSIMALLAKTRRLTFVSLGRLQKAPFRGDINNQLTKPIGLA